MKTLLNPHAVAADAVISVIAPASFAQQARIDAGLKNLRGLGFAPTFVEHAQERGPLFFAGTREQRLADLHSAFATSDSAMLMAIRGGYGSNYLLDGLDLELIRTHPKPFFAYSDMTGLQLYLLDQLGLPAFHGPMLAADFYLNDGVHMPSFQAALAGEPYSVGPDEGLRLLKAGGAGKVNGILYGGCLSILVAMLGTKWEPATEGKLLFLEDTGEKPHRIDRMLWQLRHAGKFQGVRGLIFGEMLDCVSPGASNDLLDKTILSALDGFEGPIAIGLRSGHVSRQNVTLTFGVEVELQTDTESKLSILEPAVTRS
jgi:muramoyltetrapeptide carboxypeptidase